MTWEVASDSQKHVKAIADALGRPRTDPRHRPRPRGRGDQLASQGGAEEAPGDQEGHAVSRVVFNAITKDRRDPGDGEPRDVDMELVEAYLARRALDYLVGFNLSPVLWRKLPGAKSAGRVQSVALRLIVEREMEIEAFRPRILDGDAPSSKPRAARASRRGSSAWRARSSTVTTSPMRPRRARRQGRRLPRARRHGVEAKPATRNPAPPFMTSTLQQEASRKFGFGARRP
jgi:DNA topoisomerase-1